MREAIAVYYHVGGGLPLPALYQRALLCRRLWTDFGISMRDAEQSFGFRPLSLVEYYWMFDLLRYGDERAAKKQE